MDASGALRQRPLLARLDWRITPLRLVAGLTLLALALRLTNLGARPLWLDEAFSKWFSDQDFAYLWSVLPTYEAHPPFYYSLLKSWRGLFGDSPFALRSLSAILGVLTVPVAMASAFEQERLASTGRPLLRAGIVGFLVACSPMLMVTGQEARPYPLLTFGYALAILALFRLMREFAAGGAGRWSSWVLLGVSTELTLWAHALGALYGACLAVAVALVWLKSPVSRARLVRGIVTGLAVGLAYLPCLSMMVHRTQDWSTNWLAWEPSMLLQVLVFFYSVPVEALTIGSAVAALAMLLLIKRALVATFVSKGWNSDRLLLLLWLGPPIAAALISATYVPVFLARTLTGTLVPAYLAIAAAAARTSEPRERRMLAAAICVTLLPTASALTALPGQERWDLAASYLSSKAKPNDQIWLYPSDSALPLRDASPHLPAPTRLLPAPFPTLGVKGPIRAGWPAMVSLTPEQADAVASDPALKQVRVVWLVTRQSGIFDADSDLPRALARVRRPGKPVQWGYIAVQPYYLR